MGLRCLLGHDFDEPELRREREEDGDEVVTTVTEVKTCARCGETQIVSENTEVTTMEQLTDEAAAGADAEPIDDGVGGAGTGAFDPDTDPNLVDGDLDDATTGTDDAVILDDHSESPDSGATDVPEEGSGTTAEDDGAELLDEGVSTTADDRALDTENGQYAEYPEVESGETPTGDEENAETDDGVILDDEAGPDADRERGAWPEVEGDEREGGDPTPWPEQQGEDEGYSAEVGDDDASGGVEFGGGLTPEAADGSTDENVEYVEAPERDPSVSDAAIDVEAGDAEAGDERQIDEDTGITRGESPDLGPSTSDVTTEYYCPECGMTREADGNSMRAGDICPECKRGYVDERPI